MKKRERGFTLIELIITMAVFLIVLTTGAQMFSGLLTQFKQQSKIAETNIEGAIGLEILRQDLEQAGYGLPWNLNSALYNEAVAESGQTPWVDRDFNDGPPDNPARGTDLAGASNPPGAIRSGNDATSSLNHSDVLIIKGMNVARHLGTNNPGGKWTTLQSVLPYVRTWSPDSENNLLDTDKVVVINPGSNEWNSRTLITADSTSFAKSPSSYKTSTTTYANVKTSSSVYLPTSIGDTYLVYGVDSTTALRMPFNRADYYLKNHDMDINVVMPARCAHGTGILFKAVLNQSNGIHTELPLLDCVADMQVTYWLDTDADGNINWPPVDSVATLTAKQIRDQLKEVRVYVVAQEGQKDSSYDFSMGNTRTSLSVIESLGASSRTVSFANLSSSSVIGTPEYKYYRWKLYTMVVKPKNLK